MDAIDLLRLQHQDIERLFTHVFDAQDDGAIRDAFGRLADRLATHMAAEERVFYPAVKMSRTEDLLFESVEEHLSVKRLMADLLELDHAGHTFRAKLKVLHEQVSHHHREEEERLFARAFKLLDPLQRHELGERMIELQREVSASPELRETIAHETRAAARI